MDAPKETCIHPTGDVFKQENALPANRPSPTTLSLPFKVGPQKLCTIYTLACFRGTRPRMAQPCVLSGFLIPGPDVFHSLVGSLRSRDQDPLSNHLLLTRGVSLAVPEKISLGLSSLGFSVTVSSLLHTM